MQGRVDSWRPNNAAAAGSGENGGSTPNGIKPAAETTGSTTTSPVVSGVNGHGTSAGISTSLYSYMPIRQTHNSPAVPQQTYRPPTTTSAYSIPKPSSTTSLPAAAPPHTQTLNSEMSAEKRFTSVEKGKGRIPSPPSNGNRPYQNRPTHPENQLHQFSGKDISSTNGGMDPTKANVPTTHVAINPAATGTISPTDKAFAERVEANDLKPKPRFRGTCPVWSNTRKSLQSALEYMRNPIKTAGASVDISPGGMARGIILEGPVPSDSVYWGEKEQGDTMILPIGKPRARRRAGEDPESLADVTDESAVAEKDDTLITPLPFSEYLPIPTNAQTQPTSNRALESPEIEALLLTHRARTPIAVAVARDYAPTPFRLPRPFVVLGWFWITEAWVEPVVTRRSGGAIDVDDDRVVWKFRFEYQFDKSEAPWWQDMNEVEPRPAPVINSINDNHAWPLTSSGPTLSYTSSEDIQRKDNEAETAGMVIHGDANVHECRTCKGRSARAYADRAICLNEACKEWEILAAGLKNGLSPFFNYRPAGTHQQRITAKSLRMDLRPPEPVNWDARVNQPADFGREYWTGWVCGSCGCASERKKWYGWTCESCGRKLYPKHWNYSADKLRAPLRPVSTGPRPDDGLASWPFEVTHAWTLFDDDIKVVRHGVEAGFGKGTVIYHSLNHEGAILARRRINVNDLFMALQRTEPMVNRRELAYRRHYINPTTTRMCERYLSPFYTLLLGPEPVPAIESLPTAEHSVPWYEADPTFLDLADLINERAGQIFPGEPEFNSLLVAVTPPGLSASQAPRIYVPALSYMSFTFLGSDGVLKFRRPAGTGSARGKQGQITLQHGDIVGVQTGAEAVEVIAQQDGFGMFCIGRQIYRLPKDNIDQGISSYIDTSTRARKPHVTNKPPPRPTKDFHVPLTYWYIGPYPLDPERPMKVQPSLQIHPADISMPTRPTRLDDEEGYNGIEVVHNAEIPRLHDPPHIPGEKNGRKRKVTDQSESTEGSEKVKAKAKPRKSAAKVVGEEKSVDGASPAKKKGRKSGGAAPKA